MGFETGAKNMTPDETLDLLQVATLKLTQGGSLKDRLVEAYASHLVQLDAEQLPEELRNEFQEMHQAMKREQPLPRESIVRASVRKMSIEETNRHAAFVVRLFAAFVRGRSVSMESASSSTARRKTRHVVHSPIINLFASEG